jgi:hypothetical protein
VGSVVAVEAKQRRVEGRRHAQRVRARGGRLPAHAEQLIHDHLDEGLRHLQPRARTHSGYRTVVTAQWLPHSSYRTVVTAQWLYLHPHRRRKQHPPHGKLLSDTTEVRLNSIEWTHVWEVREIKLFDPTGCVLQDHRLRPETREPQCTACATEGEVFFLLTGGGKVPRRYQGHLAVLGSTHGTQVHHILDGARWRGVAALPRRAGGVTYLPSDVVDRCVGG